MLELQILLERHLDNRVYRYFDQIDSTNDYARGWLMHNAPPGAVVIADEQLKGRGRKGRHWHTPPGVALACSVILYPPRAALPSVTMLGGLAIAEMIGELDVNTQATVGIKWPNDVLLNGRKVSGILAESVWDGTQLRGVVLGMGVNVRVDFGDSPLAETATNLESAFGTLDRGDLYARLLNRVDYWAPRFNSDAIFHAWRDRLTTIGQTVVIMTEHGEVSGQAEGVTSAGALRVRDADGVLQTVLAGDIALT